ncbi:hypothetical protein B0H66DRAFT_483659 [Apodospora peruviana]|uniref:Helicase C-terminal domain-containing protein n=1 Tax=Apodospora peruviana TaxID=516989 RepID=A0AAE0HYN1_9PEZI|nr:hypothetical protein B0H66DRAFT_483659 [Apodospora peruviana]
MEKHIRKLPPALTKRRPEPELNLELIEAKAGEYKTDAAQDDDYGAIDLSVVDTYVGSFNTGDNEDRWSACLDFFHINPDEYAKQEAMRVKNSKDATRKRVPMKKLPGMSVGMFDYQLVGILNMLLFILNEVSGGLLCDEQGLGKTQEMFGAIALAHNLRKARAEVKAAWKSGKPGLHHKEGEAAPRACPADDRYGFRCYCYNKATRKLADNLPEGPNLMLAPTRSVMQLLREAKTKIDAKVFKLRLISEQADKEDTLTPADMKAVRASVTATKGANVEDVKHHYQPTTGVSDFIIIIPADQVSRLSRAGFAVDVKQPDGTVKKKGAFVPGMVLMDEFHEYTAPSGEDGSDSRTIGWLKYLKESTIVKPLVYFVSGTPFGDSPADIRPAISLFEKPGFKDPDNGSHHLSVAEFDKLTATFKRITDMQNRGEVVPNQEISDYHRQIGAVLSRVMVRRLGVDKFRGRNLTDLGPLSVNITDHKLPDSLKDSLQALADSTRDKALADLGENSKMDMGTYLRSEKGEQALMRLRLASTFPGTASAEEFTFSQDELQKHLAAAGGNIEKTPYFAQIPIWSAHSAKIESINKIIGTMMADKSKILMETTIAKKLILFAPLEEEAMLLYGYLLIKKQTNKAIKPAWIHTLGSTQTERQKTIDKFLEMGNAPPNILVAPMSLAGTGLNLQKAKYSVVVSPAWVKRDNQQAFYRTHRVGQKQQTQLFLLTARWNPAERVILGKYEGVGVEGDKVWTVGDEGGEGGAENQGGLVDRHQVQAAAAKGGEKK